MNLAPGENQRDMRDYSASGRGCVMCDCQIERNTTVAHYSTALKLPRPEPGLPQAGLEPVFQIASKDSSFGFSAGGNSNQEQRLQAKEPSIHSD